jgi:hypothetical protein
MALWGNKDTVYATGTVDAIVTTGDNAVITGDSTVWSEANGVVPGLVISFGSYGGGVIKSVDSTTQLTLIGTAGITAGSSALGQAYNISEAPKFTAFDSNINVNEVYGSDNTEVGLARTTVYSHDHAGWVGITTYMATDGAGGQVLRTKTEVLVAMGADSTGSGGITSDAADDSILRDS